MADAAIDDPARPKRLKGGRRQALHMVEVARAALFGELCRSAEAHAKRGRQCPRPQTLLLTTAMEQGRRLDAITHPQGPDPLRPVDLVRGDGDQVRSLRDIHTSEGLNRIDGFRTLDPTATFYVFPNVARVCNELGVTSHGLALFMLQGADDSFGIACLGGECFGEAGAGFLRFSCAESNERLQQALDFIPQAISRTDRLAAWLERNPQYRLPRPYPTE